MRAYRDIPACFVLLGALLGLGAVGGCGPTAYKITPVPASQAMIEKELIDEGGWLPAKIVLIDVDGALFNRNKTTLFGEGENPVSVFVEQLDKAYKDKSVKALILRINSPGGSVTASDLMYSEVIRYKHRTENKKPVLAMMMDVAASGGYYLACSADRIMANPTTVTGSIGVIMQTVNFSGTMNKLGISTDAITSGKMKDAGSPLRPMKPKEREVFQQLINQFFERFIAVVKAGRPKLSEERIRELADGRVYTGQQAFEAGLVDQVGTLREAIEVSKQTIDAKTARVVTYCRPLSWTPNIYAQTPVSAAQINLLNIQLPASWARPAPEFLYLWSPTQ